MTSERNQEKQVIKQNLTENEHKISSQLNKIRELTNMVQDLTTKNKSQELAAEELSTAHKAEISQKEEKIREINNQFSEQQNVIHEMKTEHNSMKITINQLTQTVEGQKTAYENLRNQMANVYKEHQQEQAQLQSQPASYTPVSTINFPTTHNRNRNSSFTRNITRKLSPHSPTKNDIR